MSVVGRLLRYVLSVVFTLVAAWCVYRGMRYLFGFETRPTAGRQVASLAGVATFWRKHSGGGEEAEA